MKLTQKEIDQLMYDSQKRGSDFRWDDNLSGFGVRVYPSGDKSFVISYRCKGRKRIMTLGSCNKIKLVQAKEMARSKMAEILNGADPMEARKSSQQGETMRDLCSRYIDQYSQPKKKTWKEDLRRIEKHVIPAFGTRKIHSITRSDVQVLHQKIGKQAPYEANRVLALLSSMFSFAKRHDLWPEDRPLPAQNIDKFKELKRDRWVQPHEMPRLLEQINQESNVYIRSLFLLYLLTGARKNELLRLKWEDVDISSKLLNFRDTKSGRPHVLPLSEPAVELLKQIPRLVDNPHVFPGRRKGRCLVNVNTIWKRIRKAAGLEDVRIHDLRRTFGSWLASSGHSLVVIGKALNHNDPSTTARYAHLSENSVRNAMDKIGKQIDNLASNLVEHTGEPSVTE